MLMVYNMSAGSMQVHLQEKTNTNFPGQPFCSKVLVNADRLLRPLFLQGDG
jgi:hypothetical protein